MKIISTHKDFYDFLNGVDTDATNVYVRKTDYHGLTAEEIAKSGLQKFIENSCYYSYSRWNFQHYMFYGYILGIYPNIYVLNVILPPSFHFDINRANYMSVYDDGKPGFVISNNMLADVNLINKTYGTDLESSPFVNGKEGVRLKYTHGRYGSGSKINAVIEKPEFFKLFGCPIFFGPISTNDMIDGKHYASTFIVNPNLCELNKKLGGLLNVVREIDPNLNNTIYDRIENYLYSSRVEPTSEPDNNTRIVNAGFDLKTSFRNIK